MAGDFGVTVRTLHHYDAIGLVSPSKRTESGYRLYTETDLRRLQEAITYRRLDMPLEEIRTLLDGDTDVRSQLQRQRAVVAAKLGELNRLIDAIDTALGNTALGNTALENDMTTQPASNYDLKELFGDGYDDAKREAEERWGDTDAWAESQRRTRNLTKEQWADIKAEGAAIEQAFAAAKRAGHPADSTEAMDAAEAHRNHIGLRFYDCDHDTHRGLADMYVSDPRFAARYDEGVGEECLSVYVHDAIYANADRHT